MSSVTLPDILKLSDTTFEPDPAQDIRGRKAVDSQGNDLGVIDELMIDDSEKKVRFIRVATGGFLGMGKAKFLIPVDAIVKVTKDRVSISHDREKVATAPVYDPNLVNEAYYNRLYGYYGYPAFWQAGYMYPTYPYYVAR
jgi:uncharacterized protein YrrD